MALRDHSLDNKINQSAFFEFSEKGYRNASLRKIADRAGVTVGAIRTRYKTKDELFCSLLSPLVSEIEGAFAQLKTQYFNFESTDLTEHLRRSMQMESEAILHLIFDRYDAAKLLLCKSEGSSLNSFFDRIVEEKVIQSIYFFRSFGIHFIDEKAIRLLISSQFDCYLQIVRTDLDREEAEHCLQLAQLYHYGGWMQVLEHTQTKEAEI